MVGCLGRLNKIMDINILYKLGGVDSHEAIADGSKNSCSRYGLCRGFHPGFLGASSYSVELHLGQGENGRNSNQNGDPKL